MASGTVAVVFVGLFSRAGRAPRSVETAATALWSALDPFDRADDRRVWTGDGAQVAIAHTWNTAESRSDLAPVACPATGRVIAAWSRLDNRPELLAGLGLDAAAPITDTELILQAYDAWGETCPTKLVGDFSFAIFDPREQTVFVGRDPLGVKPLYYYATHDAFVVATTAALFPAIDGLRITPSQSWMARYVAHSSMSHTDTGWEEVHKLAGSHQFSVDLSATNNPVPRRYFSFQDSPPDSTTRSDEWVDAYRSVLEEAVRCRIRTSYKLGVETSGGIDSSTCLGFAAQLWPRPLDELHAFGFIHAEDEPDFIYETSRQHGVENNHVYRTHQMARENLAYTEAGFRDHMLEREITVLGYPQEHANGSSHDLFYFDCEQLGVRTLLSGFGGDEVVTNPAHLLNRELLAKRRLRALWANTPGGQPKRTARFARTIAKTVATPNGASRLRKLAHERWPLVAVRAEVAEQHGLEQRYIERHNFDQGFNTINGWALTERLGNGFVPTRLENCTLMANARGVHYRWPLLDVRLIQQYLSTPSLQKQRAGMGRLLHREAIEGVVPPKVQWKPSKYMGVPLGNSDSAGKRGGPDNHRQPWEAPALAERLHPAVESVVDVSKLRELARQEVAGNGPNKALVRRQVRAVQRLDTWMGRHHP